jgi:MscS family membrane protein
VVLVVATYVIYEVGEFELLGRFMTGLGVAGLAASLAAQDALKSFFGTLLLIGERAFKIGDHIVAGGTGGVVEQVGFRSTRLRTAEGSVLTIPNAIIAAAPIVNMGDRSHRPFGTTIMLDADASPERLLGLRDRLQAWLAGQALVVQEKVDVHLERLTTDGVELNVSLSLATGHAAEEARFREELNCEVLAQAGAMGVRVVPASAEPVAGAGDARSLRAA